MKRRTFILTGSAAALCPVPTGRAKADPAGTRLAYFSETSAGTSPDRYGDWIASSVILYPRIRPESLNVRWYKIPTD